MLGKLFDRQPASGAASGNSGPRVPRHSGGWGTLRKRLAGEEGLRVLDIGSTSPTNINYLTSLGHSVYMADLVEDAFTGDWLRGTDEDGKQVWDVEGFTKQNLHFSGRTFDMVLLSVSLFEDCLTGMHLRPPAKDQGLQYPPNTPPLLWQQPSLRHPITRHDILEVSFP